MFTPIETSEDLLFLNQELLQCPCVGIDTEFRRTTKDNMKLALMQVNDSNEIYLIDCLQIKEPKEICSFLSSQDTKKIFHSCREDIEAIYSWTKQGVLNIYDTQIANSLLGGSFSISYQDLVKEKIGLKVDKEETRTNWLRRPLSEAQLNYAAIDVYYLIDLYRLQRQEFSETNKLEWLEEESNKILVSDSFIETPKDRLFNIQKKEEREILLQFNNMVKAISRTENINPTLFFSKQNQKILLHNTLILGLEGALNNITKWRRELIKDSYSLLVSAFGIS
jgi:ribonuclease D